MVRVTITDRVGEIVQIMEYARRPRLDRKIMRSIEVAVGDTTIPYSGYLLPLTICITTNVSRVYLFADHLVYYDGVYCNITRKEIKYRFNYVSSRRIWNKWR